MPEKIISALRRFSRKTLICAISLIAVVLVAIGCSAWAIFGAQKHLIISIDNSIDHIQTFESTVSAVLDENEIVLSENDIINVALNATVEDGDTITIITAKDVVIEADGEQIQMNSAATSVESILSEAGVALGEMDIVEPSLESPIADGMVIDVDRVTVQQVTKETEIAYTIERKRDSSMSIYEEKVLQEGQCGLLTEVYDVTYRDGEIISQTLVSSETQDPVNEIVATGSYDVASRSQKTTTTTTNQNSRSGNPTAPNGMAYSSVLTCTATAYTHDGTKTASGSTCRVGAIAVDPSVIPLGTKLYVEGYGVCTAEDTGGLIVGNRIDVFLNTESECQTWGVKTVKVYILAD